MRFLDEVLYVVGPFCSWRCMKCGQIPVTVPWPLSFSFKGYRVVCAPCAAFVLACVGQLEWAPR